MVADKQADRPAVSRASFLFVYRLQTAYPFISNATIGRRLACFDPGRSGKATFTDGRFAFIVPKGPAK